MFNVRFFTMIGRVAAATGTAVATALVTKAAVEAIGSGLRTLGEKMAKPVGRQMEKKGKDLQDKAA